MSDHGPLCCDHCGARVSSLSLHEVVRNTGKQLVCALCALRPVVTAGELHRPPQPNCGCGRCNADRIERARVLEDTAAQMQREPRVYGTGKGQLTR